MTGGYPASVLLLTLLACAAESPDGPFALAFDGGEDCVEVDVAALDVPVSSFTVEAWIRGEPAPADRPRPVVSWNGVFSLGEAFGGDTSFSVGGAEPATTVVSVMDGVLHHLAGTWDGETASLYVDGVRQAFADGVVPVAPTATLRVGCDSEVNAFEGVLDEVRISTRARYTEDFDLPSGPFADDVETFALFHFDEGEGAESYDNERGYLANVYDVDWIPFKIAETE